MIQDHSEETATPSRRSLRVRVYGPAYLDRVLRIQGPLLDDANAAPIDTSIEGKIISRHEATGIELHDEAGTRLTINVPPDWPGPRGVIQLLGALASSPSAGSRAWNRTAIAWHDDLGGMGAGYAKALGGTLVSALGDFDDSVTQTIASLLAAYQIPHRAHHVYQHPADWTLLITTGAHGDKLAVGSRGCHAAVKSFLLDDEPDQSSLDVVVVAGLPNRQSAVILRAFRSSRAIRVFAPAMRNMLAIADPVVSFTSDIDLLTCNRQEWETLNPQDRAHMSENVGIICVTNGDRGANIQTAWTTDSPPLHVPAFPRLRPIVDTNRAGEAFGATLVQALLEAGWRRGQPVDLERIAACGRRAAAAATLVLDLDRFGFPESATIDRALCDGRLL